MSTTTRATVEELYHVADNGKAEIVDGEIRLMSPSGSRHGRAALKIILSLGRHEEEHNGGHAFGDNVGFLVDLPERQSFSPDAAWYIGDIEGMDFLPGPPLFAVEIRGKNDYGPRAEEAIARKIDEYLRAGTLVVWDVDLLNDDAITVHRASDPDHTTIYRRGDFADAEPAVAGWRLPVDVLFG